MKVILLIFFVFFTTRFSAIDDPNYSNQLSTYIKVWGLMKYYDSNITKNKINWDSVFVNNIKDFKSTKSKNDFNILIRNSLLHSFKEEKKTSIKVDNWLNDTSMLSLCNINFLKHKVNTGASFINKYVQPIVPINNPMFIEDAYSEMIFPKVEYRILSIARYWNIINYFYPYKDLIDSDWDKILPEYISKAISCNDALSYNLMIMELTEKINDTHAITYSKVTNNFFNVYRFSPAIQVSYQNKQMIISKKFSEEFNYNNLNIGDTILAVNDNFNLLTTRDSISKYVSASNYVSKNRLINDFILNGKDENFNLTIKDGVKNKKIELKRFPFGKVDRILNNQKKININDSLSYINLGILNFKNFDSIINLTENSKYLIIDLRDYAKGTLYLLGNYLLNENIEFALIKEPNYLFPGKYKMRSQSLGAQKNKKKYKGKLIVLIDEYTQSQNEFIGLMLSKVPNSIFIGTQTAGTNGDVSKVVLPGNIITYFSGLGVYNTNNTNFQRVGLKLDIEVYNQQLLNDPLKIFLYYYNSKYRR